MALYGITQGALVNALDTQQIINFLTGVMTDQQATLAHATAPPLRLNKTGAAAIQGELALQRGGTSKAHIGLDAADLFAVLNAAGTTVNMGMDDSGNANFLGNLTVKGGTLLFGASNALSLAYSALAGAQTLTVPVIREAETLAIKPQFTQSSVAAPTGTASTTGVMMGLAGAFTPQVTGRVFVLIHGDITNNTANDGANVQLRYGTGGAPTNGAALTGTTVGSLKKVLEASIGPGKDHFVVGGFITALTINTAIWLDVGLAAVTGGTATIADVDIMAVEF